MSISTVKVAAVQLRCDVGETSGNLDRAAALVDRAAALGARVVLLPELTPGGYVLTEEIWNTAEPMHGASVSWLRRTARRLGIYLGMSFLEAEGPDFYNSFVLATPLGDVAGRVRKNPPASAEAYFFRAGSDPHVIDTELGRFGVSICYEAVLYDRIAGHHRAGVDMVLCPMSAGTPTPVFPIRKKDASAFDETLRSMAVCHARALGVPVVMANKCGPLVTAMPAGMPAQNTRFPGLSTIVDSDGCVKSQLGGAQGIAVAEVAVDPARKVAAAPRRHGRWAMPVPWFFFLFPLAASLGRRAYARSGARAARALAVGGK